MRERGHNGPIRLLHASAAAIFALGIALFHSGQLAHADTRLEAPSYGNIDQRRLASDFPALDALLAGAHVIPGLHENFVPQGIEFLESGTDEVVLSGYFCERFSSRWRTLIRRCVLKHSAFYLFDLDKGKAVRLALLNERNGKPMRRHAAGVAELHGRLWLPGRFEVLRFSIGELRNAEQAVITMHPDNGQRIGVDSSGDFITAFEDTLWIGNFQRGRRTNLLPVHYRSGLSGSKGWTAGYRIDPDTLRPTSRSRYDVRFGGEQYEVYRPDRAFHHGSNVQGISFIGRNHLVLSTSFGPGLSALTFHRLTRPPLREEANGNEAVLPDGSTLWVRTLAIPSQKDLIVAPPGAEGVAFDGIKLAVAFEGGALPYRNRWRRIEDRILLLQPPASIDRQATRR